MAKLNDKIVWRTNLPPEKYVMHLSQDCPHHTPQWDFVKRFVTRFVVFQVQTVFIPSAQRIEIEPLLIFQVLIWQKHMSGHRDSLVAKSFLIIMLSLWVFHPILRRWHLRNMKIKKTLWRIIPIPTITFFGDIFSILAVSEDCPDRQHNRLYKASYPSIFDEYMATVLKHPPVDMDVWPRQLSLHVCRDVLHKTS